MIISRLSPIHRNGWVETVRSQSARVIVVHLVDAAYQIVQSQDLFLNVFPQTNRASALDILRVDQLDLAVNGCQRRKALLK